ncbi:MAG: hypothetical protein OQK73_03455 [Gammaproteobacteria bacterium]|nr:hypothetical protein [Gammaproteobacteria bacterium]
MSVIEQIQKLKLLLAGLLITLPLSLQAGDVNLPQVPKAKANATEEHGCVTSVKDMRKNHMEYLLHQRDDTIRRGVRTKQYSLAECVECHVTEDTSGEVANFGEDKHFCSSCHNYVAVSIDCFQCHNDKPQGDGTMSSRDMPASHHNMAFNKHSETGATLDNQNSESGK